MDLQKAIKQNLHYYSQVKATNDAHRTKAVSTHLRKEYLENKKEIIIKMNMIEYEV